MILSVFAVSIVRYGYRIYCVFVVLFVCGVDVCFVFFFQAEDGIRDLVRSRGLGDVYKRQPLHNDATLRTSCSGAAAMP